MWSCVVVVLPPCFDGSLRVDQTREVILVQAFVEQHIAPLAKEIAYSRPSLLGDAPTWEHTGLKGDRTAAAMDGT